MVILLYCYCYCYCYCIVVYTIQVLLTRHYHIQCRNVTANKSIFSLRLVTKLHFNYLNQNSWRKIAACYAIVTAHWPRPTNITQSNPEWKVMTYLSSSFTETHHLIEWAQFFFTKGISEWKRNNWIKRTNQGLSHGIWWQWDNE